jgi:hypothetical protein
MLAIQVALGGDRAFGDRATEALYPTDVSESANP